jgi:hypothetical protein
LERSKDGVESPSDGGGSLYISWCHYGDLELKFWGSCVLSPQIFGFRVSFCPSFFVISLQNPIFSVISHLHVVFLGLWGLLGGFRGMTKGLAWVVARRSPIAQPTIYSRQALLLISFS